MCYAFYNYAINNKGIFTAIFEHNKYESIERKSEKLFEMIFKVMKTVNISDENINHIIRTLQFFRRIFFVVNNNAFGNPVSIKESF